MTQSCKMSSLKLNATKCVQQGMQNLTKNVFNQKNTELCVPISVTTLLRHSLKNDLRFKDEYKYYTFEAILATLTMIVFPQSMAGLNLNPNEKEKDFQQNQIEILLQRVCQKTYLMETGWEIIQNLHFDLTESTCEYKQGKSFFPSNFTKFSNSKRKVYLHSTSNRQRCLFISYRRNHLPSNDARPSRKRRLRSSKHRFQGPFSR